jgi:hypothetical protein
MTELGQLRSATFVQVVCLIADRAIPVGRLFSDLLLYWHQTTRLTSGPVFSYLIAAISRAPRESRVAVTKQACRIGMTVPLAARSRPGGGQRGARRLKEHVLPVAGGIDVIHTPWHCAGEVALP